MRNPTHLPGSTRADFMALLERRWLGEFTQMLSDFGESYVPLVSQRARCAAAARSRGDGESGTAHRARGVAKERVKIANGSGGGRPAPLLATVAAKGLVLS